MYPGILATQGIIGGFRSFSIRLLVLVTVLFKTIMQFDVTSCIYRCVICMSNQPKYLVDYDRWEQIVKCVLLSFAKMQ